MRPAAAIALAAAILVTISTACAQETGTPHVGSEGVQEALSSLHVLPDAPGAAVVVLAEGAMASAATGLADSDGRATTVDTPMRIASLAKTFTAAAIPRLKGCADGASPRAPSPEHVARLGRGSALPSARRAWRRIERGRRQNFTTTCVCGWRASAA